MLAALEEGYRLIDTANAYVNEKAVGRAVKKSGLKREEIFLETKLWPSFYEDEDAVDKTLERLGTDYIDLPAPPPSLRGTMWPATGRWRKPTRRERCGPSDFPTSTKSR